MQELFLAACGKPPATRHTSPAETLIKSRGLALLVRWKKKEEKSPDQAMRDPTGEGGDAISIRLPPAMWFLSNRTVSRCRVPRPLAFVPAHVSDAGSPQHSYRSLRWPCLRWKCEPTSHDRRRAARLKVSTDRTIHIQPSRDLAPYTACDISPRLIVLCGLVCRRSNDSLVTFRKCLCRRK